MYTGESTGFFGCANSDLFFVDSRRRAQCLRAIYSLRRQNPELVVCLHDAQRSRYHQALALFEYVQFFSRGFATATNSKARHVLLQSLET